VQKAGRAGAVQRLRKPSGTDGAAAGRHGPAKTLDLGTLVADALELAETRKRGVDARRARAESRISDGGVEPPPVGRVPSHISELTSGSPMSEVAAEPVDQGASPLPASLDEDDASDGSAGKQPARRALDYDSSDEEGAHRPPPPPKPPPLRAHSKLGAGAHPPLDTSPGGYFHCGCQ
jgi:hypothetical protein